MPASSIPILYQETYLTFCKSAEQVERDSKLELSYIFPKTEWVDCRNIGPALRLPAGSVFLANTSDPSHQDRFVSKRASPRANAVKCLLYSR